jgi:hypothetical protein
MAKAKFDIFERDGAVFRRPHGRDVALVDHVRNGDDWIPYKGDRSAPVHFGTFMGVEEHEAAVTRAAKMAAE